MLVAFWHHEDKYFQLTNFATCLVVTVPLPRYVAKDVTKRAREIGQKHPGGNVRYWVARSCKHAVQ